MTKLEILQADYNTLSRTVVQIKRKDVFGMRLLTQQSVDDFACVHGV